jgi:hypothetical protein
LFINRYGSIINALFGAGIGNLTCNFTLAFITFENFICGEIEKKDWINPELWCVCYIKVKSSTNLLQIVAGSYYQVTRLKAISGIFDYIGTCCSLFVETHICVSRVQIKHANRS